MVDVPDLGSGFWEFKSPPGQTRSLGGTVDTVALKATLSRYRFKSDSGYHELSASQQPSCSKLGEPCTHRGL